MSEVPNLKRDGTMEVTAQAGKEFLESHGMTVTDDDVKTRAQKEKLDQVVSSSDDQKEEEQEPKNNGDNGDEEDKVETTTNNGDSESPVVPPKVVRDGTMDVTAKEGLALLAGEELEKTRGQTTAAKSPTSSQTSPISKIKRTTTIAQTTQDSSIILGQEERRRTRSQTRKISESGEEEKKPPAVKRAGTMEQTIKAGEEYLESEAKRAKLDSEKIPEVDETPVNEETKAEA